MNARYGNDPGVTFYTHISDQYSPFYTKLINLTGDYHWRRDGGLRNRKLRPLRTGLVSLLTDA